jgi:hypothetical protein
MHSSVKRAARTSTCMHDLSCLRASTGNAFTSTTSAIEMASSVSQRLECEFHRAYTDVGIWRLAIEDDRITNAQSQCS